MFAEGSGPELSRSRPRIRQDPPGRDPAPSAARDPGSGDGRSRGTAARGQPTGPRVPAAPAAIPSLVHLSIVRRLDRSVNRVLDWALGPGTKGSSSRTRLFRGLVRSPRPESRAAWAVASPHGGDALPRATQPGSTSPTDRWGSSSRRLRLDRADGILAPRRPSAEREVVKPSIQDDRLEIPDRTKELDRKDFGPLNLHSGICDPIPSQR
jgi:hypothetical protein